MGQSLIDATYSAVNSEGVEKYRDLVLQNVNHVSAFFFSEEKFINGTDGTRGSYWTGSIGLVVEDDALNTSLVQLDSVEAGFAPGAEEVLELVFGDARYEVTPFDDEVPASIVQLSKYTHNKIQEQTKSVSSLEVQVQQLTDLAVQQAGELAGLKARYDNLQAFLHSYIDIKGLVQIVRRIAEEVDPDILDDYAIVKVQ
jgi:hypothetical protein